MKATPLIVVALLVAAIVGLTVYYPREDYCGCCYKDVEPVRTNYAGAFAPTQAPTGWTISDVAGDAIATLRDKDGRMINNVTCTNPSGLIVATQLLTSKLDPDRFTCSYATSNENVFIDYSIQPYSENCTVNDCGEMKCPFWPARPCPNPTTLQVSCNAV